MDNMLTRWKVFFYSHCGRLRTQKVLLWLKHPYFILLFFILFFIFNTKLTKFWVFERPFRCLTLFSFFIKRFSETYCCVGFQVVQQFYKWKKKHLLTLSRETFMPTKNLVWLYFYAQRSKPGITFKNNTWPGPFTSTGSWFQSWAHRIKKDELNWDEELKGIFMLKLRTELPKVMLLYK